MSKPRFGNGFEATLYRRKTNSHEYDMTPVATFTCRMATDEEKRHFYPLRGLNMHERTTSLYTEEDVLSIIEDDDKLVFMGKEYIIDGVGVYLNQLRMINPRKFKSDYIIQKAPKGIKIV